MKLYDVWFVPDREKPGSEDIPACPSHLRGLEIDIARRVQEEGRNSPTAQLGEWKVKAASTWARDGLSWWAGRNEERYSTGPYPTREQAFLAGLAEQWDEVHLCEAAYSKPTVPYMVDHILERYEESNEELGDPEGDGFSLNVNAKQEKDLQERFVKMFEEWRAAHHIEPKTFMFDPCHMAPAVVINLRSYLEPAIAFSFETFGPGTRSAGVIDHIRKEIKEAESDPSEWVDIAILALDGAWRSQMHDDRPDDPPNIAFLADHINGLAEYCLNRPGRSFEEVWDDVQGHPDDTLLWAALHTLAMRQWDGLHVHNDKGLPVYHELFAKLTINQLRVWPDWRGNQSKAIEHDRSI